MTRIKLHTALAGVSRLGIDTDCIIYFVQANPSFDGLVSDVFRQIAAGQVTGHTSAVSLTETLVIPLRTGDLLLRQRFRDLLLRGRNMHTVPISAAIAERAAEVRALYNLKVPDAMQAATALETGCEAFLTNNGGDFRRVTELNVLVLNELTV